MAWTTLLAYGFGLLLIYALARLLYTPLRWALTLVMNGLVGGAALWVLNWVGAVVHLALPLNPLTALAVGVLGVPGLIMVVLLRFWVYG